MSTQEILDLPRLEKLRVIELLWADLAKDEDTIESPEWHQAVLEETAKRVKSGEESPMDWAEAKKILREKRA